MLEVEMSAKWILFAAPAAVILALSAPVDAGGYKSGYYGAHDAGYGVGYYGPKHHGHAKYRHKGYRAKAYRHGYRSGYRHAKRHAWGGYRKPYRAYRHGYRKGYRHGYRHAGRYVERRSYYPDTYRYDPLLGHVRGIYFPSGHVSLHFGF
jgi:hypothetical protein